MTSRPTVTFSVPVAPTPADLGNTAIRDFSSIPTGDGDIIMTGLDMINENKEAIALLLQHGRTAFVAARKLTAERILTKQRNLDLRAKNTEAGAQLVKVQEELAALKTKYDDLLKQRPAASDPAMAAEIRDLKSALSHRDLLANSAAGLLNTILNCDSYTMDSLMNDFAIVEAERRRIFGVFDATGAAKDKDATDKTFDAHAERVEVNRAKILSLFADMAAQRSIMAPFIADDDFENPEFVEAQQNIVAIKEIIAKKKDKYPELADMKADFSPQKRAAPFDPEKMRAAKKAKKDLRDAEEKALFDADLAGTTAIDWANQSNAMFARFKKYKAAFDAAAAAAP